MVKAVAGFGIPAAPANVKLEKTDSRLILTWDETNTASDGAGAFIDLEGMTYTVVDASGATVAADLRERLYETELPGGDARSIKFGVIADNHGKRSDTAWSPSVQVGEGISLPYRNDLDSQEKFSELLTDDANNDGTTWVFNAAQGTAYIQTSKAADDWLLTPTVTLEKGRRYRLGMKVKNNNRTRQETVGSGFRADKETEYTVVREATVLPAGTDWQEYADEFEVPATGTYRVGKKQEPSGGGLYQSGGGSLGGASRCRKGTVRHSGPQRGTESHNTFRDSRQRYRRLTAEGGY